MLVIGDPLDPAVRCHIEPDDSLDFPRAVPEIEENDRGLAVHFAQRQPPCHPHTFVDAKIARIGDAARESIGNEQTGIRADQFAQPVPIAAIESFDVKLKDPVCSRASRRAAPRAGFPKTPISTCRD